MSFERETIKILDATSTSEQDLIDFLRIESSLPEEFMKELGLLFAFLIKTYQYTKEQALFLIKQFYDF